MYKLPVYDMNGTIVRRPPTLNPTPPIPQWPVILVIVHVDTEWC